MARGYMHISRYDNGRVSARDVNITCDLPSRTSAALSRTSSSPKPSPLTSTSVLSLIVSTTLELVNAFAYQQQYSLIDGPSTVVLTTNISIPTGAGPWPETGLEMLHNASVRGYRDRTQLDLQGRTDLFLLGPAATFTLVNLTLVNLNQAGSAAVAGDSSLLAFAYPVWAVQYDR